MTPKRRILSVLNKSELLEVAEATGIETTSRHTVEQLRDLIAGSKRVSVDKMLPLFSRDSLKSACTALGLVSEGREKKELADRILAAVENRAPETKKPVSESKKQVSLFIEELKQAFPSGETQAAPLRAPENVVSEATKPRPSTGVENEIRLEVLPRKPRLAWQGMWRPAAVTSVPTQVVEIVRPGRARRKNDELGLDARVASARDLDETPPNRLIWTNDNLVALKTLLDERDERTRDYRYRGKVDLVYIDPPFMVNSDFRADNSIDIELDDDAGVQAKKEPSLVEILAYKDTWRQGLDSFLSMLRHRLVLLKELLAPTGSIYVHLDWHAAHYVKVMMDEVFGYENFVNEIVWRRQTAHNDLAQGAKHLGRTHDTILLYGSSANFYVAPVFTPYDSSYVRSHYKIDESGRRYQLGDISGRGGASKGNAFYSLLGHERFWAIKQETAERFVREGRIVQSSPGAIPRFKRFLDEMPGIPLQDFWTDLGPINSMAVEALGYPTQKPVALLERIINASTPPHWHDS